MSFEGTGTGVVYYQIGSEQTVNNTSCTVVVLEDDPAGMLTLNVSFTNTIYGQVQIGISLFNYSPSTTSYNSVASLMIGFYCQTPQGGWVSNAESSVMLFVEQAAGTNSTSYNGSFNAGNLNWIGSGNQDSLAIKFGSYSFTVTDLISPSNPDTQIGAGTGSVTYTFGAGTAVAEQASANTFTYYQNGVYSGFSATLRWNDPVQGAIILNLMIVPFTGAGSYNNSPAQGVAILLAAASAGTGNWSNDSTSQVSLNVTAFDQQNYTLNWIGSIEATGLTWQGSVSQPDLDVNLSAFSFTLTLD